MNELPKPLVKDVILMRGMNAESLDLVLAAALNRKREDPEWLAAALHVYKERYLAKKIERKAS